MTNRLSYNIEIGKLYIHVCKPSHTIISSIIRVTTVFTPNETIWADLICCDYNLDGKPVKIGGNYRFDLSGDKFISITKL